MCEIAGAAPGSFARASGPVNARRRFPWGAAMVYAIDAHRRRQLHGLVAGYTFRCPIVDEMRFRWPEAR
jgi:hypothetical protein